MSDDCAAIVRVLPNEERQVGRRRPSFDQLDPVGQDGLGRTRTNSTGRPCLAEALHKRCEFRWELWRAAIKPRHLQELSLPSDGDNESRKCGEEDQHELDRDTQNNLD